MHFRGTPKLLEITAEFLVFPAFYLYKRNSVWILDISITPFRTRAIVDVESYVNWACNKRSYNQDVV